MKENSSPAANKREALFEALLRAAVNKANQQIPRRLDEGPIPLSFAQQRLWFLDQLEPGNTAYNVFRAVHLTGNLNPTILEKCLNEIVYRHESLRTIFTAVDGHPTQIILPNLTVSLPVIDLRELPKSEREAQVEQYIVQERQRVFNLRQSPLLQVTLLQLTEEEQILLLVAHHLITDGWSMGVLFRELSALYEAYLMGQSSPLADLPIQYADFTVWQREWLQGETLETQLTYWKQQLAGYSPVLNLPTDRPRPAIQTLRGGYQSIVIAKVLTAKLKALSQKEGATLFMTLLAAFQTLLYRYTGQDDIVIGSPIAGRTRGEVEELIGLFINTLVLRTDLSGNPTFQELLGRVRETALGAYDQQDLPFEKLVEELQPERDLSRTPLFQVLFNMYNFVGSGLELPGLTAEQLSPPEINAQFDLTLEAIERNEEIHLKLIYNTDLFDASTITRMLGHFETLLKDIVTNPNQPLLSLSLLTEDEQYQLCVTWNETQSDYPQDLCVHELFEAQVERTPEAVAVVFEDKRLTYRQLNKRANQLAHYLKRHGVGPDVPAGIYMERSLEMMVGILGVLKAGGAYVPLDPAYPSERLDYMIKDTRMPVILSQERLATNLFKHSTQTICLDSNRVAIAQESEEKPTSTVKAENLVYIIYTSGSTGTPKGVLIPHQALINHSTAISKQYDLRAEDKVLQFASMSFDVAVEELFPSWISGASVVLRSNQGMGTFRGFLQFVEREQLTVLNLPTAYWHEWVSALARTEEKIPSLVRLVITGSEKVSAEKYRSWREIVGDDIRWMNGYGPTEATITATCYEPEKLQDVTGRQAVPIGRPLANIQIYLLDQQLNPVPIGVPGELYIGGDGLARGYHNRPELTAELFIPNPFSEAPGGRLYKTGDLARYLPDGTIEFLRRIDHQVKIRGYRIELGEIEAILRQHAKVEECIIDVWEDNPDDKRLVSYVVPNEGQSLAVTELNSFLKERLPDYMLPSTFILLDNLPLTPNGKVNRRLLPEPDNFRPRLEETTGVPSDQLELQLAKIWENVLNVRPISLRDDFFELGGHSLLAVRLFAQLEKVFGKNLPLATLFQAPTIEQLSRVLRDEGWRAPWASLVPIQPQGAKPPFFCVHAVGGNVLSLRDLAHHLGTDQPFYALQSQGLDGKERPPRCVQEMAAYYIDEIRTVQPEGPYYLGGQSSGGLIAFEMAQQLRDQGEEVALLALIDTQDPSIRQMPIKMSVHNRISFHLNAFMKLGSAYALEKIEYRLKEIRGGLERVVAKMASRIYTRLEQPLPQQLRYTYVREAIRQAMTNYTPPNYEGRITLFRATNTIQAYLEDLQGTRRRWDDLAVGGIEIYDIDGAHNLEQEPYVRVLAEKLKLCLYESQTNSVSTTTPKAHLIVTME